MRRDSIHPAIQEAIGAHEAFRKLGFASKDIFIHFNPDGEMLVVLETQGKMFSVQAGRLDGADRKEWEAAWTSAASAVIDGSLSDEDLAAIWQACGPCREPVSFLSALLGKGIRILKGMN